MIGYQLSIRAPDATALVFGARRLTYAQLNERACRLANGLAALGVGRGCRVAALTHNCNYFVEALFATAKLGAIFVPLNFRLVAREIALQLEASTPAALIAAHRFAAVLESLGAHPAMPPHVLRVDDEMHTETHAESSDTYEQWLRACPAHEPHCAAGPEDVQMLMHSSGTTGLPKGVVFTHATTYASCAAKIIDFALTDRDVTVVFGPLFHAGPLMDLTLPLLMRGGTVVLGPSRSFDPRELVATIAAERATVVPIYPTMLRRVLAAPTPDRLDLSALRLIITGGEAAPVPVISAVHERFPGAGFINNYGSTEGGPVTTFLAPAESLRKIGSVGKEAFSVEVRIADEEGRAVSGAGAVGEILVRSPFVCRGYWNRPEETARSLRDGWWRTGDLGWRDDEGFLWIAGRSTDLIKSGAESIYPIEVEQAIAMLPGVQEVGVVGVPDDEWGETVAAYVVKDPAVRLDTEQILAHCRQWLAGYKKPRHVVFIDSLPRGPTSKVSKAALRERWEARRES